MNAQKQNDLYHKLHKLHAFLRRSEPLGVAFSGGVDSTLLLAAALQVPGNEIVAFTADSAVQPSGEMDNAVALARELKVRHVVFATHEIELAQFRANSPQRCYHCKRHLLAQMQMQAEQIGIRTLAHGANIDDLSDFRPGFRAAREMGVIAPLIEAQLTKKEIRALARILGLSNWNRPAMACLATRVPYGIPIDPGMLAQIDQAESIVRQISGGHCRVRHHGDVARIETDAATVTRLARPRTRRQIVEALRALGYAHVCLDLEGYVSGKMNRGKTGK
jgi:pyridinium-3,5-biscarboxylic acid mononucleotide sulfurtransferase